MTEYERMAMRDMLEAHRKYLLERADQWLQEFCAFFGDVRHLANYPAQDRQNLSGDSMSIDGIG